ncbi:pimeloyl-ACP methyl ester carboxylesterase [Mycoplasmoides fastidiosum]|uniref:Pimeloyl-ACP methyl ester carboxylesterase n=1 Tax=Mycoplasmoides fastidiosum TaxID=92758 RepID=A0ABU0LZC3_9BACT|nr:alpha/beta hydrolase [Mycoplasmoides fastidiosum]MDQ0514037.1 pimeloyl-ACP methyl ester carboxylesterase [Mycoplasmoides fastidiosum]UUD37554.1 alpha/beta hydrolase [Mycoplasmoides fastidiosum]
MNFFEYNHLVVEYFEKKVTNPKGTIFYLPGFSSSYLAHQKVEQAITDYDYYSVSYPGHGRTIAHKSTDFNIHFYVEIVLKFIEMKQLHNLIFVGHSMGGAIAALIYRKRPDLFVKMFLIGPVNKTIQTTIPELYPIFFPDNFEDWLKKAKPFFHRLGDYLQDGIFVKNTQSWIQLINSCTVYGLGYRTLGPSLLLDSNLALVEEGIKAVEVPFWMVYGQFDRVVNTPKIAQYYQTTNPSCHTIELANCGHSPWIDDYQLYLQTLKDFLAS